MALAPMAIRAAYAAVTAIPGAMIGHRDAVGIAAPISEALDGPRARLRGLHHPRLAREWVEEGGEAGGRPAQG